MVDSFFQEKADAERRAAEAVETKRDLEGLWDDTSLFLINIKPHILVDKANPHYGERLGFEGTIVSEKDGQEMPFAVYLGQIHGTHEEDERRFLEHGRGELVFDVPYLKKRLVLRKEASDYMLHRKIETGECNSQYSPDKHTNAWEHAVVSPFIKATRQLVEAYSSHLLTPQG